MTTLIAGIFISLSYSKIHVTTFEYFNRVSYRIQWCDLKSDGEGRTLDKEVCNLIGSRFYKKEELTKLLLRLEERKKLNFDNYFPTWKELEHLRLQQNGRVTKLTAEALTLTGFLASISGKTALTKNPQQQTLFFAYAFVASVLGDHVYYTADHIKYFALRLSDEIQQWRELENSVEILEAILNDQASKLDLSEAEARSFNSLLLDELP